MKIRSLVWHEIAHRKGNFAIGLFAVAMGAACSVGVVTLLRASQLQTAHGLAAQSAELKTQIAQFQEQHQQDLARHQLEHLERVRALDDEIRKITKNLGFNLLILPADQNLADFHAADFAEKTMPENYVKQLAEKGKDLATIAHLRAKLVRKIDWPEKNRQLLLMGVAAVVPVGPDNKKPLAEPVPPGSMNVGSALARELSLSRGSEVIVRGERFVVDKVYPQRGNKDDITAWVDLAAAQKITNLPGRINMMEALECNCATVDRLAEIQEEVAAVLGGKVQVIELTTQAIARAKARNEVQADGIARIQNERLRGQATLDKLAADGAATLAKVRADADATLGRLERLAALVLPLVIFGACLMVAMVCLMNVRERRSEIGILRAVGVRSRQIFGLFVSRAAVLGVVGAVAGYALGFFAAAAYGGGAVAKQDLFVAPLMIGVVIFGPLLAVLAGWLPAVMAASEDPAVALREE